jgi:hypothetical protein
MDDGEGGLPSGKTDEDAPVNNHLCKIRMKINRNLSSDSHFHHNKTFVFRFQPFSKLTANISNYRSYLCPQKDFHAHRALYFAFEFFISLKKGFFLTFPSFTFSITSEKAFLNFHTLKHSYQTKPHTHRD